MSVVSVPGCQLKTGEMYGVEENQIIKRCASSERKTAPFKPVEWMIILSITDAYRV